MSSQKRPSFHSQSPYTKIQQDFEKLSLPNPVTLPIEIIIRIIQFIPRSQKASILTVNSTFYKECIPDIYRDLIIDNSNVRGILEGINSDTLSRICKSKNFKYTENAHYLDWASIDLSRQITKTLPTSFLPLFGNCQHIHLGSNLIYKMANEIFEDLCQSDAWWNRLSLGEEKSTWQGFLHKQVKPKTMCIEIATPWIVSLDFAGIVIDLLTNGVFKDQELEWINFTFHLLDDDHLNLYTGLIGKAKQVRFRIDIDYHTSPGNAWRELWEHYIEIRKSYPGTEIIYEIDYVKDLQSELLKQIDQQSQGMKPTYDAFIKAVRPSNPGGPSRRRCGCLEKIVEFQERKE